MCDRNFPADSSENQPYWLSTVPISRLMRFLVTVGFAALVASCGGGGGSSGSTGSGGGGTPGGTSNPAPVSGKLVAETRFVGLSQDYQTDAGYKQVVDAFLPLLKGVVDDISTGIKWPTDVPVVFSGCGFNGAFFSSAPTDTSTHDVLRIQGSADPATSFGPDIRTKNIVVMCNDLTERTLKTYFQDPASKYRPGIRRLFASEAEGILLSAAVFQLQVLFHEIGHGLDFLLLNDPTGDIKRNNFVVPLANTCSQNPCDTVKEDFGDWVSAYVLTESIKKEAKSAGLAEAKKYAAALLIASVAWNDILGGGRGAAHGFTNSRQLNILCYAYGGSEEVRAADRDDYNFELSQLLNSVGGAALCQQVYKDNAAATQKFFGQSLNF